MPMTKGKRGRLEVAREDVVRIKVALAAGDHTAREEQRLRTCLAEARLRAAGVETRKERK